MARTKATTKKRARTKPAPKKRGTGRAAPAKRRAAPARRARTPAAPLLPVRGAARQEVGGVRLDVGRAGVARVKRCVYPAGFRWSVDLKAAVGTELCMHAHVGYLASGTIRVEYPDGCVVEYVAPEIVAIEPGHDGAVVGDEPAVLIEFDFEADTVDRLGMPGAHRHP